MKKSLKRINCETYYYKNSKKVLGVHSGIRGNVTDIRGNVTGISGNVTGIRGNVDLCEITEKERRAGIKIEELVEKS